MAGAACELRRRTGAARRALHRFTVEVARVRNACVSSADPAGEVLDAVVRQPVVLAVHLVEGEALAPVRRADPAGLVGGRAVDLGVLLPLVADLLPERRGAAIFGVADPEV